VDTCGYTKLYNYLASRGLKTNLHRLDNEAPGRLTAFMRTHDIDFQLMPPHNHRRNADEKAIGTWKDNFIAGLSSLDPSFSMHFTGNEIDSYGDEKVAFGTH
jgi:hypothetical protein